MEDRKGEKCSHINNFKNSVLYESLPRNLNKEYTQTMKLITKYLIALLI